MEYGRDELSARDRRPADPSPDGSDGDRVDHGRGAVSVSENAQLAEEATGDEEEPRIDAHLDGLEDGAGCTEIWERLSEQRASDD